MHRERSTDLKRSQDRKGAMNLMFSSDSASASPARAMSSGLMPLLSRNSCRAVKDNTRVSGTAQSIVAHACHNVAAAKHRSMLTMLQVIGIPATQALLSCDQDKQPSAAIQMQGP
jgi:hypothetical protein